MEANAPYVTFNTLYDDFILKLIDFFPEVSQLRFYHQLFLQFRSADFRIPARLFLSSVADHSLYVFNRDERYFMSGIEITKNKSRAVIEKTIIKEWKRMSEIQKDTVWAYLQQMLCTAMNIPSITDDADITESEQNANDIMHQALIRDGVISPVEK